MESNIENLRVKWETIIELLSKECRLKREILDLFSTPNGADKARQILPQYTEELRVAVEKRRSLLIEISAEPLPKDLETAYQNDISHLAQTIEQLDKKIGSYATPMRTSEKKAQPLKLQIDQSPSLIQALKNISKKLN